MNRASYNAHMARHTREPAPATDTLTLRLTVADRDLLDRLVTLRSAELAHEGIEVTAASLVRGLIRREAAARGIEAKEPPPAPERPKPSRPAGAPDPDEVRAAIDKAVKGGKSAAEIARSAGLDPSQLSRFRGGKGGLAEDKLAKLAKVVEKMK